MLGTAVITDTLTVFAQCIRNLLFSSFKITGTKRFFLECIRNRLLKHTRKEAVKNHMAASLVCYKKLKAVRGSVSEFSSPRPHTSLWPAYEQCL